MLETKKYDFSAETAFKDELLAKCRKRYCQVLAEPLDDDDLDLVAAAGARAESRICPYVKPCDKCSEYIRKTHTTGYCAGGYIKQES